MFCDTADICASASATIADTSAGPDTGAPRRSEKLRRVAQFPPLSTPPSIRFQRLPAPRCWPGWRSPRPQHCRGSLAPFHIVQRRGQLIGGVVGQLHADHDLLFGRSPAARCSRVPNRRWIRVAGALPARSRSPAPGVPSGSSSSACSIRSTRSRRRRRFRARASDACVATRPRLAPGSACRRRPPARDPPAPLDSAAPIPVSTSSRELLEYPKIRKSVMIDSPCPPHRNVSVASAPASLSKRPSTSSSVGVSWPAAVAPQPPLDSCCGRASGSLSLTRAWRRCSSSRLPASKLSKTLPHGRGSEVVGKLLDSFVQMCRASAPSSSFPNTPRSRSRPATADPMPAARRTPCGFPDEQRSRTGRACRSAPRWRAPDGRPARAVRPRSRHR